jgi:hypothetical protein
LSDPNGDPRSLVRDAELRRLWEDLERAREVHRDCLRGRQDLRQELLTRADVLGALEDFVAALANRHVPIPPRLQREVALLKNLAIHPIARRRLQAPPG